MHRAAGPAGFGSLPAACARTELSLQAEAAVLVAFDDFYGSVEARGALRGSFAFDRHVWLSLHAPGPHYRYLANATVDAESLDVGATALGLNAAFAVAERLRFAPYVRALVPTESVFEHARRYGVDHGFVFALDAYERLELFGGGSFPALFTTAYGRTHTTLLPSLALEAAYSPLRRLSALAGVTLRIRGGDLPGFESFEPALAIRYFPFPTLRTELAAGLPLFGEDRTDFAAALHVGWIIQRK